MDTRIFESFETVRFQQVMKPHAIRIYKRLFPGCELVDLREGGVKVHVLDQEFGIDALLTFPGNQWISIQEKYRDNCFLKYGDFTQEYKNADGTIHESHGEWFKLGAQLYFYGWANSDNSDFSKWVIIDIAKYKLIVNKLGGIEKAGEKRYNWKHGRASFYCIPLDTVQDAILFSNTNQE